MCVFCGFVFFEQGRGIYGVCAYVCVMCVRVCVDVDVCILKGVGSMVLEARKPSFWFKRC